jgi:hypothetical protein
MTFEPGQQVIKLACPSGGPLRISEAIFDGDFEWYRLESGGCAWHKPEEFVLWAGVSFRPDVYRYRFKT